MWKVSCFWFDSGRNTPSDNFVMNQPLPPLPSEDLHLTGERFFLIMGIMKCDNLLTRIILSFLIDD